MRYAIVLSLLLLVSCKGPKGEQGDRGAAAPLPPSNQADLLVFEGAVTGNPTNVFIGTIGDDQIILAYIALNGAPNDWIQLGYPTGDNAPALDPWYSRNGALVSIHNGIGGDHYKVFVIPLNMLSSFKGLPDRLVAP